MNGHKTVQATFGYVVNTTADNTTADDGLTTLREALGMVNNGGIIIVADSLAGKTITLASALPSITKSLTIEGNGVTISGNNAYRIMDISASGITVTIRRVHFANGKASYGGAICNAYANLILQSCIFSGNSATSSSSSYGGGAVYTTGSGTLSVLSCTFYSNTAYRGGAIYQSSGTTTLTGNIFYGNTANSSGDVIYLSSGTVTSNGYNVYDNTSSGFTFIGTGDAQTSELPFSKVSFAPVQGSVAIGKLPAALPTGYPAADFYGNPVTSGGAAGAVQLIVATFAPRKGSSSTSVQVGYLDTVSAPAKPLPPEGYFFVGWYADSVSWSKSWDFATDLVVSDTTLYAKWEVVSADATLSSLTVSEGTLSPAFDPATTAYTLSVPNSVSSISIAAVANHAEARVSGAGSKELSEGANTISIVVTAEDGITTKTYTVTITRQPLNTGVEDAQQAKVALYPNPVADGELRVEGENLKIGEKIAIYSASGKLVGTYEVSGAVTIINVAHLAAGVYIVTIGRQTTKIMVNG
jgi:uncharacterized repeat protein (TIGR02543 family)